MDLASLLGPALSSYGRGMAARKPLTKKTIKKQIPTRGVRKSVGTRVKGGPTAYGRKKK